MYQTNQYNTNKCHLLLELPSLDLLIVAFARTMAMLWPIVWNYLRTNAIIAMDLAIPPNIALKLLRKSQVNTIEFVRKTERLILKDFHILKKFRNFFYVRYTISIINASCMISRPHITILKLFYNCVSKIIHNNIAYFLTSSDWYKNSIKSFVPFMIYFVF